MAGVSAGVVTAVQVNGPLSNPTTTKWLDASAPSTWAVAWFLVAVIMLFIVL